MKMVAATKVLPSHLCKGRCMMTLLLKRRNQRTTERRLEEEMLQTIKRECGGRVIAEAADKQKGWVVGQTLGIHFQMYHKYVKILSKKVKKARKRE
jgi:hypothetical protein